MNHQKWELFSGSPGIISHNHEKREGISTDKELLINFKNNLNMILCHVSHVIILNRQKVGELFPYSTRLLSMH